MVIVDGLEGAGGWCGLLRLLGNICCGGVVGISGRQEPNGRAVVSGVLQRFVGWNGWCMGGAGLTV